MFFGRLRAKGPSMSLDAKHSVRRFRDGSAILLVCLSLPVADLVSEEVGAEMAAFGIFVLIFIAWLGIGLLMDALWGPKASEMDDFGYAPNGDYLSQP